MEAAELALVARALDEAATALDPTTLAALRAALTDPGRATLTRRPHGSILASSRGEAGSRPLLEIDRHGTLLSLIRWRDDGRLAEASVRIPDGRWVTIEPCVAGATPWGASDRLWLAPRPGREGATPLADFAALDYAAIGGIPTLGDPTRLPPGVGTTVLNLIATLALEQDRHGLRYGGPYPTEQLFLALLECFHYVGGLGRSSATRGVADPLAAFVGGALSWDPAPHERLVEAAGVVVQLRERVNKVTWEGRTYYRPDWQTVARHAPRRVRDADDGVVCSLWALGTPLEDHLRLSVDGSLVGVVAPPPLAGATCPVPADVVDGVVAGVAATSVPALAPFVREAGRGLKVEWGPVERDLVDMRDTRVRISTRLRAAAVARLRDAHDRGARVALAFTLLAEIIGLLGDALRARAQVALAARPAAEQEAALRVVEDQDRDETAPAMGRAAESLLADLAS